MQSVTGWLRAGVSRDTRSALEQRRCVVGPGRRGSPPTKTDHSSLLIGDLGATERMQVKPGRSGAVVVALPISSVVASANLRALPPPRAARGCSRRPCTACRARRYPGKSRLAPMQSLATRGTYLPDAPFERKVGGGGREGGRGRHYRSTDAGAETTCVRSMCGSVRMRRNFRESRTPARIKHNYLAIGSCRGAQGGGR